MKKIFFILFLLFLFPSFVGAQGLGHKLSGRILIDVQKHGEAWYVDPADGRRYYLGRPADAFRIMRQLGLGISEADFREIAAAGSPAPGDGRLARRLSGRIILEVQKHGEAWYVDPLDLKRYYLGRPADAFRIMRQFGLGISSADLATIKKALDDDLPYARYRREVVRTPEGVFQADVVEIDLNDPDLRIITETAADYNCKNNCPVRPLSQYVAENGGFAALNGTYFNISDPAQKNYYFFPVYDSNTGVFINEDQLKWWTTGPVMAFDQNNRVYYFKDSREFKSVADFESRYGVKLQAAIGMKPRLVEGGIKVLKDGDMDVKQKTVKALKGSLAYKDGKLYLIVVHDATVPELADCLVALGMRYAINIDGGYSSALYFDGEFLTGPGRDVPNAIIFKES